MAERAEKENGNTDVADKRKESKRQRCEKEGKTEGKNGTKPREKIKRASVTCAKRERASIKNPADLKSDI